MDTYNIIEMNRESYRLKDVKRRRKNGWKITDQTGSTSEAPRGASEAVISTDKQDMDTERKNLKSRIRRCTL